MCGKASNKIIDVTLVLCYPGQYHTLLLVGVFVGAGFVLFLPPAFASTFMIISQGKLVEVYVFFALHPFIPIL